MTAMMKNILKNILLLAACVAAAASCTKSGTENPYDREPSISITSSDLLFSCDGGEGVISVKSDGDFTVRCTSEWITCTREGQSVFVEAKPNNTILGRSATITLFCGQDSVKAVAQQVAYAFIKEIPGTIDTDDNAQTFTYTYDAPYEVTATATKSWVKASVKNGKLVLSLDANNTGVARLATVYLTGSVAHSQTDSISISQFDFEGRVAGYYNLDSYASELDEETNEMVLVHYPTRTVMLKRNKESSTIELDLLTGFSVPLVFDPENMTLSILAAQYCGAEVTGGKTYYIYTTALDSVHHSQVFGNIFGLMANIQFVSEGGKESVRLEFKDNGVWPQYYSTQSATGFYLYRFTNPTPSYQYAAGNMEQFIYPILTKL